MLANKESVLTNPTSSIAAIEPVTEIQSTRSGEDNKIIFGLTALVGVGLVVFGISAWNLFDISRGFRSISEKNFRLQELSGKIVYFDEVLTMSARMSAYSGDPRWEKRYLEYDPQLVAALEESAKIAPEAYKNLPTEVSEANTKLVDLEKKSFELVRQGKKNEATQILFGTEYEAQKKIYADGSSKTLIAIENETQGQLQSFSQRLTVSLVFTLLTLPALIGAYLIALKLIRAYLSDRDKSQKSIAAFQIEQTIAEQERARMKLEQSIAAQDSERSAVLQRDLVRNEK